jgi:pimeloyl-ACP methyl ester carboxylesterase
MLVVRALWSAADRPSGPACAPLAVFAAVVELAHTRMGSGPPVVLVHGAAADAESFRLLEPLLARAFTVVTVDRRGRRGSPDEPEYAIEREFDDLVALVDARDRPAVFGHSFGANVAFGAALRSANVSKLVVYEPGHRGDATLDALPGFEELLERGDRAGMLGLALREFAGFPAEHVAELLEVPVWQERLAYAPTIVRELRAYRDWDDSELERLDIPVLVLVGGESDPEEHEHASALAQRLPRGKVRVLEGHGHIATFTGPTLLAELVTEFLRS